MQDDDSKVTDPDAASQDQFVDGSPLPAVDRTPLSTPKEYEDARTAAIESNDLGKMAQFIGSLPPDKEEIFRQLRAEADRENRALIGGLIGIVTGTAVAVNAAPSNFLETFLEGALRLSNHEPSSPAQDKAQAPRVTAPKPYSPSDF